MIILLEFILLQNQLMLPSGLKWAQMSQPEGKRSGKKVQDKKNVTTVMLSHHSSSTDCEPHSLGLDDENKSNGLDSPKHFKIISKEEENQWNLAG